MSATGVELSCQSCAPASASRPPPRYSPNLFNNFLVGLVEPKRCGTRHRGAAPSVGGAGTEGITMRRALIAALATFACVSAPAMAFSGGGGSGGGGTGGGGGGTTTTTTGGGGGG